MTAVELLSRLDGVKRTGWCEWVACCPAHDDHHPSLSIKECEDGTILLKCFVGCDAHSVVFSAGLSLHDLFPPRGLSHRRKGERRPFSATTILHSILSEAWVVAACARAQLAGPLSDEDRKRLMLAVARIEEALAAGGINDVKR
jgi:hypothetical protein